MIDYQTGGGQRAWAWAIRAARACGSSEKLTVMGDIPGQPISKLPLVT
jgi:hypothetical protein